MSGTYTRYTVENADGDDWGSVWEESEYQEAKALAQQISGAVIVQEYVWEDSELVDDFRVLPACEECGEDITEQDRTVNGRTFHESCYLALFSKAGC